MLTNDLIYQSARSKIFLTKEEEGKNPIILKILNNQYPSPQEINQFYNELSISDQLTSPGIRKVIEATKVRDRYALKLEWFDGATFLESFKNKQKDILDFLFIAIEITRTLEEIHSSAIIHKDITPNNLLVNLQKRQIKFIDFGISAKFQSQHFDLSHPKNLQGTLTYCSPEQTGRMNRSVDFRSDLYSLGITFFTILAGEPPFVFEDAMELVHAHIAHDPPQLRDMNPAVPLVLSEIIAKLIEKNAEERYQSAYGLRKDLELCLREFQDKKEIKKFEIGQHDYSALFRIHQKLYGREKEIKSILEKYEECANGTAQLLLIAGYSGTGKTALVHEVHRPITLSKGFYAEWKFDQFNKSTPYSALLKVLTTIVDLLLSEEENRLRKIIGDIRESVGEEGRVLTDLLPNLKLLIGDQPEIPELGGEESQHRFTYLVQKFIRVIANPEHPVVFFIDDLQWADAASMQLLSNLLSHPDMGYFLCIGAYRDNEVGEGHTLLASLANMEIAGVTINTIHISNLLSEDIQNLIVDSMNKLKEDPSVAKITELVLSKTNGNAFFTIQFLKSLAENNLLLFDKKSREWTWDIDTIKSQNITDNVVELVAGKIKSLPDKTQAILKFMAALGNTVDLAMLAIVAESSGRENELELQVALKEGLVFHLSDKQIKFAHDRIQQAVYSLFDNDESVEVHYKIGRLLHQDPDAENELIFEIVNHYNSAQEVFKKGEESERIKLAELNYKAASKASHNSAFEVALDYLHQSLQLLPDNSWKTHYELTFAVHRDLTETSYLCTHYDLTDKYFDEVIAHSKTAMDKVKVYEVKINAYKAKNNLTAAIEAGLEALILLGKKLPRKPNKLQVFSGLIKTEFKLRNITVDSVDQLPMMVDEKEIRAMRIMANLSPSAYWAEPNLLPMIAFEMLGTTLKHGLDIVSAFCFAGYGIIQCGVLGSMRKGEKYGEIGLRILELFNTKEWNAQIVDPVYALILPWNKHVELSIEPLKKSFYTGLETGENEFACVNANIGCIHAFLCGKPLPGLQKEMKAFSQSFIQLKQETQSNYNEVYRQALLCFIGDSENPAQLAGSAFDSNKMLPVLEKGDDKTGIFFIHFLRMIIEYYFEDYTQSNENGNKAYALIDAVLSKFEIPNLYFYRSLSALALIIEGNPPGKNKLLKTARQGLKKLRYYSKFAPENYKHKCTIIESQLALSQGQFQKARVLFDQAIEEASTQRFIHEEALINELAGKAYNSFGHVNLAKFYLNNALNLYREWGSKSKMDHLVDTYPMLITEIRSGQSSDKANISSDSNITGTFSSENYDIRTVIRAATSISSEVELSSLLTRLMDILIENAGAQKGALVLLTKNELIVEALSDISDNHSEILQHSPLLEHRSLPASLITYINRTKQDVVYHEFSDLDKFSNDPYFQSVQPQSILGMPIVNQGKLVGILYLENKSTKNVFTPDKFSILSMLSSQIAVSIDNAFLYENLEQKVKERTHELSLEKQKSDSLLENILPREIADELKETGKTAPKYYESVTVLFADFAGFTSAAKKMSAAQVVNTIDGYFREFDQITLKYNLEKIKTIGDAYMCAGGLPVPNSTHALDAVKAALEMISTTSRMNNSGSKNFNLDVRIGIHTGPLVAGVVGTNKFAYDIWGNTVNKASRMESNGEVGRINISEESYQIIKDAYECRLRGSIEAKNLGKVNMYFIEKEVLAPI